MILWVILIICMTGVGIWQVGFDDFDLDSDCAPQSNLDFSVNPSDDEV